MTTQVEYKERKLEIINADVTNHCNARCFFCFNDWDAFKPHNMTVGTFKNLLKLLPLMGGTDFLLSCWFEPTINPAFYDMLDLLPAAYKDKIYFTTNLVTQISDEDMERMCRANVHHINLSLETWDMEEYRSITGVKATHFFENVERLAKYGRQYGTRIHVITMLTGRNAAHFKELVQKTHEMLAPAVHEIRTPYFFVEDTGTKETLMEDLLTAREIAAVQKDVTSLGYDNLLWDVRFTKEIFAGLEKDPTPHKESSSEVYYRLRVNADGSARLGHQKTGMAIDINTTEDLVWHVKDGIHALQIKEAGMHHVPAEGKVFRQAVTSKPFHLDQICVYDGRFLSIRGWDLSFVYALKHDLQRVAVLTCGRSKIVQSLRKEYRPDVAQAMKSKDSGKAGFQALFDLKGLSLEKCTVSLGFIRGGEVICMREIFIGEKTLKSRAKRLLRITT